MKRMAALISNVNVANTSTVTTTEGGNKRTRQPTMRRTVTNGGKRKRVKKYGSQMHN